MSASVVRSTPAGRPLHPDHDVQGRSRTPYGTLGELPGAAALLAAFVVNERRTENSLLPLSIFRIKGLAAADITQLIGIAGMFAVFFFLTLYVQGILGYSPVRTGLAYLPVTVGVGVSAGITPRLIGRVGIRPVFVAGTLVAGGGVYWLAQVPLHGSYLADLLPGLVIMSVGLGAEFVAAATAANAGVPPQLAGLAAALFNASQWIGGALGLAIFSAIATARTTHLLASGAAPAAALDAGFHQALTAAAIFLLAAALFAPPHHRHARRVPGGRVDRRGARRRRGDYSSSASSAAARAAPSVSTGR